MFNKCSAHVRECFFNFGGIISISRKWGKCPGKNVIAPEKSGTIKYRQHRSRGGLEFSFITPKPKGIESVLYIYGETLATSNPNPSSVWPLTPKFDTTTWLFLKFDMRHLAY